VKMARGNPSSEGRNVGKRLEVSYDPEADALLIKVGDCKPSYGEELAEQVIVHFNERGEPVEIEVLDAAELLAKLAAAVESAKRAETRAARQDG